MKKTLSLLLCAAMLLAMVPAASAETVTETQLVRFVEEAAPGQFRYEDKLVTTTTETADDNAVSHTVSDPARLAISETEWGTFSFESFADLQELCGRTYEEWSVAFYTFYTGTEPLVITEDLSVPDNLYVSLTEAELIVPAGVVLRSQEGMSVGSLQVDGTMDVEHCTISQTLSVAGSLTVGSLDIQSGAYAESLENVTLSNAWGEISYNIGVFNMESLQAALDIARKETDERIVFYVSINSEFAITEDIHVPYNCHLDIGNLCPAVEIPAGVTVTVEGYFNTHAPVTVNGTLCNEGWVSLNAYEWQQNPGTLTIAQGGTYSGRGDLYVAGNGLSDYMDLIVGIPRNDFDRYHQWADGNERSWTLVYVGNLIRLATPTDLEWGYDHQVWAGWDEENQTAIYETVAMPGSISWKPAEPTQGEVKIEVYREGESDPVLSSWWSFPADSLPEWRSVDDFCNADMESGTYYFTVTSKGDDIQYRDSMTAVSPTWTYVKPDAQLGPCGNITWDWPEYRFDNPADSTYLGGYEYELLYAPTAEAEPQTVAWGWSRWVEEEPVNTVWDPEIQRCGPGCYYVRVRALSSDITKACNGEWSELSEPYNLTELVEDVGTVLDQIITSDPDEIRAEVAAIDDEELKSALLADDRVTQQIAELEARAGVTTEVSVTENAPAIDAGKVSVVGAGLNTLEDNGEDVTLVISQPEKEHVLDALFDSTVALRFAMDLDNVADTDSLEVPVKITLPVPTNINPQFLVILHYDVHGAYEEIHPHIYAENGQTYASFVVTGFSDFIMTQLKPVAEGDMNADDAIDAQDAAVLLWHTLFPEEVFIEADGDLNGDGIVDMADACYLLLHTLLPEKYPI